MRTIQFNFANEASTLELNVNTETGVVTVPGMADLPEFASVQEFAEHYALARDVVPGNLKNWVLVENGDVFSFITRAGTAGIASRDIAEALATAIETAKTELNTHVLVVEAFRNRVVNAPNIVDALVADTDQAFAQKVYDLLDEAGALTEEPVVHPMKAFLDEKLEKDGTLVLFANALRLAVTATADQIFSAAQTAGMDLGDLIRAKDAVVEVLSTSTKVRNEFLLAALVAQGPVGLDATDGIAKAKAMAGFAGREKTNLHTVKIGERFLKETSQYVNLDEVDAATVRLVNGVLISFVVDATIDEEIQAEFDRIEAEREAEREANGFDDYEDDICDECDYHYDYCECY